MGGAALLVRSSLELLKRELFRCLQLRSPPGWEIWNLARYTVRQQIELKKGTSVTHLSLVAKGIYLVGTGTPDIGYGVIRTIHPEVEN